MPRGSTFPEDYERHPKSLKVANGSVIGTLGNFSASIGSQRARNVQCPQSYGGCTEKRDSVLNYTRNCPENKRKILYVDTEQKFLPLCESGKRILRMAGLPTGSNHETSEFLVLRKYTPEERIGNHVREAIYRTENVRLVVITEYGIWCNDINSPSESTKVISPADDMDGGKDTSIHHTIRIRTRGRERRGTSGTELSNKAETVLQVEKDEKDPDISNGQNRNTSGRWTSNRSFRINEGGIARTAGRIPVQTQGSGQREGKVRPLQGHQRAATASHWKRHSPLKDEYGYKELEELRKTTPLFRCHALGENRVVQTSLPYS